jgi:hypothetical protein
VDRQRELRIGVGRLLVQTGFFQPPGGSPETTGQGGVLFHVADRAEQPPDLFRALTGGADDAQRRGGFQSAGFHLLQQGALELAAILRTLRVNPAPAPVKGRARLLEIRVPGAGLWNRNRQAERSQSPRIVVRLQLDIGKNHPVAAKAAFKAKLIRSIHWRCFSPCSDLIHLTHFAIACRTVLLQGRDMLSNRQ